MYRFIQIAFGLCATLLVLVACGSIKPANHKSGNGNGYASESDGLASANSKVAQEGIRYLKAGDTEKALGLFNIALKFDSENSHYHLLAANAYYIQFINGGNPEARNNAEVGYKLATRFNPKNAVAWSQLGRLYLDSKQYDEAVLSYARAVNLEDRNPDYLYGLADSSYQVGDIKTAVWAAKQITSDTFKPSALLRLKALLYATLGQGDKAQQYADAYGKLADVDTKQKSSLAKKLADINARIENALKTEAPVDLTSRAEAASQTIQANKKLGYQAWTQCGPEYGNNAQRSQQSLMRADSSSSSEETVLLPALPPPCPDADNPGMVHMDAVLIRAEDVNDKSYGVNLLQGLTGFFGRSVSNSITNPGSTFGQTVNELTGIGSATTLSASPSAINYSLNIANSLFGRNEVIARPSLIALDRTPATFFSGSSYQIGVSGVVAGASSTLKEIPVGVSVSLTPTIIDSDTVLISARISRTFIQPPATGTLNVSIAQSRMSATANVIAKYGQTIVIGGLSEKELQETDSGVPVLMDIPIVNYLFERYTKSYFKRSVVIMITPRKPVLNDEDVEAAKADAEKNATNREKVMKKYAFHTKAEEYYSGLGKLDPNLDRIMGAVSSTALFENFDKDSLDKEDQFKQSRIQRIFSELTDLIGSH